MDSWHNSRRDAVPDIVIHGPNEWSILRHYGWKHLSLMPSGTDQLVNGRIPAAVQTPLKNRRFRGEVPTLCCKPTDTAVANRKSGEPRYMAMIVTSAAALGMLDCQLNRPMDAYGTSVDARFSDSDSALHVFLRASRLKDPDM